MKIRLVNLKKQNGSIKLNGTKYPVSPIKINADLVSNKANTAPKQFNIYIHNIKVATFMLVRLKLMFGLLAIIFLIKISI